MALIQLLVGVIVSSIVMGLLLQGTVSLWKMQSFGVGMPGVQEDARTVALRLADDLRGADLCVATDSSCTVDAAIESPAATGVTIYSRNDNGTLSELQYAVSNGSFTLRTDNGAPTTVCTDATLTLTYYSASTYYSNGLTAYTPTSATTKNLAAVGIVSTVTRDGLTGRFETFIRLRNSPKP